MSEVTLISKDETGATFSVDGKIVKIPPIRSGGGGPDNRKRYACSETNCHFESDNTWDYWMHGLFNHNHRIGVRW
jgi:hypothetical protein